MLGEYDPGRQGLQLADLEADENMPEEQVLHSATPGKANFPGGQSVHVEDPGIELYVPAGHGLQEVFD
jgi:hypothetical protein